MTSKRALAVVGATGAAIALLLAGEVLVARGRTYLSAVDFRVDRTVGPDPGDRAAFELRVLGDSTAAGVGTDSAADALPVLLAERVADRLGRAVHVVGLGVSGARTADVRQGQLPAVGGDVDALVIVVGSNDVIHVTPPSRLRAQTRALVEDAVADGVPVVLGGIPRFAGVTAFAQPLRAVSDGYAAIQRRRQREAVSRVRGPDTARRQASPGPLGVERIPGPLGVERSETIKFVDIAALASPRFVGKPEAFSSDEFHPSVVGYGFWADALAPAVVATVSAPATP